VNGKTREVRPIARPLEVRGDLELTGTKYAAAKGTAAPAPSSWTGTRDSCFLRCLTRWDEILTIEGLAQDGALHQFRKLSSKQAMQCGYRVPGMI
jgi:aerobic-type carbon monoxide dehydrogenase small subunit (CoxS/CutS family)